MNSDKLIGGLMVVFSLIIMATTVLLTLILPIIDYEKYAAIGFFVMGAIISLAVVIATLLLAWIGWTLMRTKAPEIDLDDLDDDFDDDFEGNQK